MATETAPAPSIGSKITEQMLEEMRGRVGVVRPAHRPWNTGASRDTINHFCQGTGNMNPLYVDPEYAAGARWGRCIAPPTFLYTFGNSFGGGMRGIHALYGGADFTFIEPIYEGDTIRGTIELLDLTEMKGRLAKTMYNQLERMQFRNQDDVLVAEIQHWIIRFERDEARDRVKTSDGRYHGRPFQTYTAEGIKGIDEEYAREEIRGAAPLYHDQVAVGDFVPPVVKGPLRVTDIIGYLMGSGSAFIRAHNVNWAFRQEHPGAYIPNSQGIPDVGERVHWENDFAQAIGTPGAYDYGHERPSWIGQALTNWIGDDGWLEQMRIELRGVNVVGDTTRCGGRVTRTWVEDGRHLVALDVWAQNQLGEITAKGTARVRLPARPADGAPSAA